jgi:hypothetical protein
MALKWAPNIDRVNFILAAVRGRVTRTEAIPGGFVHGGVKD